MKITGIGLAGCAAAGPVVAKDIAVPAYLKEYADLYRRDPRAAALAWFANAKFGLFMHYGIYSILADGEWVQLRRPVPLGEYEKLKEQFTAKAFDADFITDMALDAGMKYVNITSRHHDSFCLFETKQNDYHSMASPAKRDLVGELSEQCAKKGLGLFLYYSYALDWRHPYFYSREVGWSAARPNYKKPEPRYKFKRDEDFKRYINFVHAQLKEILTNYGPLAGVWLDPIMGYYARPDLFPIEESYALIRKLQPQTLISFKQGATGTEDFAAPERSGHSLADRVRKTCGEKSAEVAARAWASNKNKHNEICDTMQPRVWGYRASDKGKHLTPEVVRERLGKAIKQKCNLLMNTGPLPDGSIHEHDRKAFAEVGKQIREKGFPRA
jgi:alpha-L-fucosidase